MAKYLRGTHKAKVYPVTGDYMPVPQNVPTEVFEQQVGVAEPVKQ